MAPPQPAIGIGRDERHARAAWTRDGFRHYLGGDPRKAAQTALLPRRNEASHRLVVLHRRAGADERQPPPGAFCAASHRPRGRRTATIAERWPDVAQGRPAACAHLRTQAGADETALGQQQVEHPATVELRACRDGSGFGPDQLSPANTPGVLEDHACGACGCQLREAGSRRRCRTSRPGSGTHRRARAGAARRRNSQADPADCPHRDTSRRAEHGHACRDTSPWRTVSSADPLASRGTPSRDRPRPRPRRRTSLRARGLSMSSTARQLPSRSRQYAS